MRWTPEQLRDYETRRHITTKPPQPASGVDTESDLHDQILAYCRAQWPAWCVIHARMDRKSTIAAGAQDLTIFMPRGRVLCIECKSRTGKLSTEQVGWSMQMVKLGHVVHCIRSYDEFLGLVRSYNVE